MQFGTLAHCLALTPLQFGNEFVIDTGNRRTQTEKARYAALAATGKIIITSDDFERAQAIVAALKADPEARLLLTGGKKEQTLIQERERGLLPLKARLDIHHESQRLVVELKTIHDITRIQTTMQRYRYLLWGLSSNRTESRHYPKQVTKPAKKQSVAKILTFATGQLRVKSH